MAHTVHDWMSKPAIFIDPDSSVAHAMTLMRRRNIHSLVIDIDHASHGIITTTDVRDKILIAERDPQKTKVRDIMSAPVIMADPNWSLKECSTKMHDHHFHHMPVADDAGHVIGMISATDIFTAVEEVGWGAG